MKKITLIVSALVLSAFGLLTLFLSTSVIFDLFGMREKEGNYVIIVIWANFLSAILYLYASYGFIRKKRWTFQPLIGAFIILVLAYISLKIHIQAEGLYEAKTIIALISRISITLLFAALAYFLLKRNKS